MKLPSLLSHVAFTTAPLVLVAAGMACGSLTVEPIEGDRSSDAGDAAKIDTQEDAGPIDATTLDGGEATRLEATDVSILFPISDFDPNLPVAPPDVPLRATDAATFAGNFGQLFPKSFLPTSLVKDRVVAGALDNSTVEKFTYNPVSGGYDSYLLSAIRLDPCGGVDPRKSSKVCRPEVRAIFQSFVPPTNGTGLVATDGAVHVFYNVPSDELVAMVKEIVSLKVAQPEWSMPSSPRPLGPHPLLVSQGLNGAFGRGLRTILLNHLGSKRIFQTTFFDHDGSEGDSWLFEKWSTVTGGMAMLQIPAFFAPRESIFGSPALHGSAPLMGDNPFGVDTGRALEAINATIRIENPLLHSPETFQCGGCHISEQVEDYVQIIDIAPTEIRYSDPVGTSRFRDPPQSPKNLHMFSHLGKKSYVAQRTANESAEVLKAFRALLQPK